MAEHHWVKLTTEAGDSLWVNMRVFDTMMEMEFDDGVPGTKISIEEGSTSVMVKEDPEQILTKLRAL